MFAARGGLALKRTVITNCKDQEGFFFSQQLKFKKIMTLKCICL